MKKIISLTMVLSILLLTFIPLSVNAETTSIKGFLFEIAMSEQGETQIRMLLNNADDKYYNIADEISINNILYSSNQIFMAIETNTFCQFETNTNNEITSINYSTDFTTYASAEYDTTQNKFKVDEHTDITLPIIYEMGENEYTSIVLDNKHIYGIEIYKYGIKVYNVVDKPSVRTTTRKVNDSYNVYVYNGTVNDTIIFACYKDKRLSYIDIKTYNNQQSIAFTPDKEYDSIKVMVWESLTTCIPLCAAEDVNIN